ncbi:MAG: adenylate/guanylate cyclase domain-containing protein [Myxococcales bacterium]
MPDALGAAEEVEQTLRLAQQAAERQIAVYRIWLFAFLLAASTATAAGLAGFRRGFAPWVGPLLFVPFLAYALWLRREVSSRGASPRLIDLSIVLDLAGIALNFAFIPQDEIGRTILLHFATPSLLLFNLVNLLRNDVRSATLGAVVTGLVVVPLYLRVEPINPMLFGFVGGAALVGFIGVAAARQARRNLEIYARLQLLRRYLPPQAVERVLRDNPDAALSLGGRLLTVTLLAADLRGFTALAEKLAPGEVLRQLNAYHCTMLREVRRHGGVLDKFIGDGTLVIFGFPPGEGEGPPDCGASAAVACARDMLVALDVHNVERAREAQSPLRMGIGVHTGPVVAGNIGAPGERLEFTVIGDAVNTASRLEGLTKEAGTPLLISSETAARLERASGLRELAPMHAKGKEALLRVFCVPA